MEPVDPRTILVDGKTLSVHENLWNGLDVLRGGKIQTPVFQSNSDPPENFEQVSPMWTSTNNIPIGEHGLVFTIAEYFWIDAICISQKSEGERNHQVNMMGDIFSAAAYVLVWLGPGNDSSDFATDCIVHANINADAQNIFPKALQHKRPDSVRPLLSRRYWPRMWIIQELILAREIVVLCGTRLLHWNWIV